MLWIAYIRLDLIWGRLITFAVGGTLGLRRVIETLDFDQLCLQFGLCLGFRIRVSALMMLLEDIRLIKQVLLILDEILCWRLYFLVPLGSEDMSTRRG